MHQSFTPQAAIKLQISTKLADYLSTSDEITAQLLKSGSPLLEAIEQLHDFFPGTLWRSNVELTPHQAFPTMASMFGTVAVPATHRRHHHASTQTT